MDFVFFNCRKTFQRLWIQIDWRLYWKVMENTQPNTVCSSGGPFCVYQKTTLHMLLLLTKAHIQLTAKFMKTTLWKAANYYAFCKGLFERLLKSAKSHIPVHFMIKSIYHPFWFSLFHKEFLLLIMVVIICDWLFDCQCPIQNTISTCTLVTYLWRNAVSPCPSIPIRQALPE